MCTSFRCMYTNISSCRAPTKSNWAYVCTYVCMQNTITWSTPDICCTFCLQIGNILVLRGGIRCAGFRLITPFKINNIKTQGRYSLLLKSFYKLRYIFYLKNHIHWHHTHINQYTGKILNASEAAYFLWRRCARRKRLNNTQITAADSNLKLWEIQILCFSKQEPSVLGVCLNFKAYLLKNN